MLGLLMRGEDAAMHNVASVPAIVISKSERSALVARALRGVANMIFFDGPIGLEVCE